MKTLSLFFALVFVCVFFSKAQDIHFSQFYASPLSLNPANTGLFAGNWRISNNYRTQWSALGYPFKTISFGVDKPFRIKPDRHIGLGLFVVNDNSGAVGLNVNKVYAAIAYNFKFDNIHTISAGVQFGYVVKNFKLDGITFPSQFNDQTGYFDPNLPNNLDNWTQNINYTDINIGVTYAGKFGKLLPFGGISLFHITNPKESFLRQDNKLPLRIAINAGTEYKIYEKYSLFPELITMYHKRAGNWVLGSRFFYYFPEKNLIRNAFGGIHTRYSFSNFDALIFSGGLSVYGFDIGISYDVNISALRQATKSKGAFELSIIYKDISKSLTKIALPCDRY